MVFSSPVFLFVFFPIVWLVNALLPEKARLLFLLVVSLLFYIYGEGAFVVLMLLSILFSYFTNVAIQSDEGRKGLFATIGIVLNLVILVTFKYMNFFTGELHALLANFSVDFPVTEMHLPLGISFFTFQAISSIVDVYRNPKQPRVTLLGTALYISFFPQLIAGPIVRYNYFIPQIRKTAVHYAAFLYGAKRFVYGLSKKVLVANTLATVNDKIFDLRGDQLGTLTALGGIILFGLQLYFDFSGYTDMAIGLARMFGIKIPENFNYPYISRTASEYWRRWHISLSSWIRDYIYIPLGGSRKGLARTYFNLWVVFVLCGLWHGASWNYVVFGVVAAFAVSTERLFKGFFQKRGIIFSIFYMLLYYIFLYGSFRTESLSHMGDFLQAIFVPKASPVPLSSLMDRQELLAAIAGALLVFPLYPKLKNSVGNKTAFAVFEAVLAVVLFAATISQTSMVFSDPFIYFRF